eukprot:CAMPEP_0206229970 /NCGR_PEP_ID=MMETSP0047_2-20121206/9988_1 /ASSEMBLY_ACC=CAM_ASM_000192 /TAXON_ID=195065 /ORGANISM="Chroomonas mesostigmatica_cf, Strain CCMP1168" /LENGTH=220 /DNA_ID=CAMNT_0053653319 /DNA_START=32 /DNA_END=694 /DNA_ORIENTATION=-
MRVLPVALAAAAVLGAAAVPVSDKSEAPGKPPCHLHFGLESPCFEMVKKAVGYEIRKYPAGEWWSTTSVAGPADWKDQTKEGFMRNFKYIGGDNEAGQKIQMSTPVATSRSGDSLSVSFFMPSALSTPPVPSNASGVSLMHTKTDRYFAVVQFGGFASGDDLDKRGDQLKAELSQDGVLVLDRRSWLAQYDPPFNPIFRHNEVWVPVAPPTSEEGADGQQ